jgi:hypothetical protein
MSAMNEPQGRATVCTQAVSERGNMARIGIIAWLALILVVVAGALAPSASAAQPTFERFEINETATDLQNFLTEECGVAVTAHAQGHLTIRTFSGERTGLAELATLNVAITATFSENSVTLRDVGGDLERVEPDGTAVLLIFSQVPFEFTGVLKIDLETGDVILEPQHSREGNVEKVCATLTA